MPESPRYLITAGEKEKGMEVLERMARINGSKLPPGTLKIETQVHILQEVLIQLVTGYIQHVSILMILLPFPLLMFFTLFVFRLLNE